MQSEASAGHSAHDDAGKPGEAQCLTKHPPEVRAGTNVVLAVAAKLFPRPWSYMAVIAVMLSTIGTLETSFLAFTRTMYAKARGGALHHRYARLHRTWQTPWIATAVLTVLGLVLLFLSSLLPTVNQIIKDSVNAIGFQVAFYYGLASFACAWNTRRTALSSPMTLVALVLWPLTSALFLTFVAIYSIPSFDLVTNIMGLGGIVIGVVPLSLNHLRLARKGCGARRRRLIREGVPASRDRRAPARLPLLEFLIAPAASIVLMLGWLTPGDRRAL